MACDVVVLVFPHGLQGDELVLTEVGRYRWCFHYGFARLFFRLPSLWFVASVYSDGRIVGLAC